MEYVYVALVIWMIGPTIEGDIKEVGPVLLATFKTVAECDENLAKIIKTSDFKFKGKCFKDTEW